MDLDFSTEGKLLGCAAKNTLKAVATKSISSATGQ
jgi:hypothetical protein